jgi:hypothetical protein
VEILRSPPENPPVLTNSLRRVLVWNSLALSEVLNALYESELNFALIAEWDNGLLVRLGDEMSGWDAETYVRTAEQAADWLDENAKVLYPNPKCKAKEEAARPNGYVLESEFVAETRLP